ncbi:C2 domain-containing protein 2 [Pristis pectinata]|uniref:C2 domain-containing protein 2 n=1 Tax=Pristis pectinata TaxID=685728 RepID=UPI00223E41EA|nr:C2 domain-containing protein 2 [Pristis pectinata]
MSDVAFGMESGLWDVMRWFGLVALFLASVLTLALYGLHCVVGVSWERIKPKFGFRAVGSPPSDPSDGAATLLSWLLALESWNCQWQKAWISALNKAAVENRSSFQLTVDNVGPCSSPLALSHVTSVIKSEQQLVFGCHVTGEDAQFSITVTQESPVAMGMESFNVQVSPLHIELEIDVQAADVVRVTWSLVDGQSLNLKVTPRIKKEVAEGDADLETIHTLLQDLLTSARPMVILTMKAAPLMDNNNFPVSQSLPNAELSSQIFSPPKPPRAHERKLQVKIIKVEDLAAPDIAESIHPYCVVELDNPVQKVSSSVMSSVSIPLWDQQFVLKTSAPKSVRLKPSSLRGNGYGQLELSAKSKKLHMQVLEDGRPSEILGEVTVPIDLFKKQPSGRQSFPSGYAFMNGIKFCYVEPNEMKSRQSPTLLPAKKVEKDRTVMPCGTVVTTVTAVKTKPRTDGKPCISPTDTPVKSSTDVKDADEESLALRNSEQGAPVSKLLSSSDTELLHLSGTDPVAEAAIRQLTESAKHKLKSPIKKSTIVISGVTKAPLAVDDEMTLSANYAAAMDASLRQEPSPHPSSNSTTELSSEKTLTQSLPEAEICATEETSSSSSAVGADGQFNQWNAGFQEDLDFEQKSTSSFDSSKVGTVKKSKGGFMRSGVKFFTRRRHHQKEPGMSQSHNDLVYLEHPTPLEKERKSARKQIKRLFPKSKSKAKVNGSTAD